MREKTVLERIAEANRPVTTGLDGSSIENWVTIYIMGRAYKVPADLTIMQAMEYAGYRFIRSCGCRAGFCGACATIYRKEGDYKLKGALACQTRVGEGMYLVQIPFAPAEKPAYDIKAEKYNGNTLLKYYPEIARCVSCNTCTKACPQDLLVMEYINAAIRGDFEKVAKESFDCISCGLCAVRCPAEIVHYGMAQLARRLYGRYGLPQEENVNRRVKEIDEGKYEEEFERVMKLSQDELKEIYVNQQKSREVY
jgi:formate hydrogenlyase subunit 6/NADH:ubiquinone oxidoreductase subunit I